MRTIAAFLFFCSLPASAFAQHGKADKPGAFTFPYKGDTWTGEIVAVDPNTRIVTLQFTTRGGDTDEFSARLDAGYKAFVKDHPDQPVSSLRLGDKIIAYYVAIGQSYLAKDEKGNTHDAVATENLIFQVEVFPPKKSKK
jgi:hypothetical protein